MKWALIKAGLVRNVAIGDSEFAAAVAGLFDAVVDVTGQVVGPGWTYDGSTFTAPVEALADAKARRVTAIKAEALTRITAVLPTIADFNTLDLVKEIILSIAPAARQLTADLQSVVNIYTAAKTAIGSVLAAGTVAAVDAVEVSWPS
jgi:hypothetical protein